MIAACRKGTYETKPSIRIKDVSGTDLVVGQDLVITLEFTDKEGDLGGGSVSYLRNRLNIQFPPTNDKADSAGYTIPDFPKTLIGDIDVRIPVGFLDENPDHDDTVELKLYVKDLAGNTSDTITSPVFIERTP